MLNRSQLAGEYQLTIFLPTVGNLGHDKMTIQGRNSAEHSVTLFSCYFLISCRDTIQNNPTRDQVTQTVSQVTEDTGRNRREKKKMATNSAKWNVLQLLQPAVGCELRLLLLREQQLWRPRNVSLFHLVCRSKGLNLFKVVNKNCGYPP